MLDGQFYPGQTVQFDGDGLSPIADVGTYRANAVNFDGTNDWLTRDAGLTGAADSKLLTFSAWLQPTAAGGRILIGSPTLASATERTRIGISAGSKFFIGGTLADSSTLGLLVLSVTSIVSAGWFHVIGSFDMADTGKRHLYLNDVDDLSVTTYTDAAVDFTYADWSVGAVPNGNTKFTGDVADLMFWPGVYTDFSVEANRRLFIDASGKPVHPKTAIASLGAPLVLLHGISDSHLSWHTNKGSGGGFTENGALTNAADSPSD